MELAIFFVLVAVIFGSVVVYFKGTFPYVLGILRVANALEGVSIVSPRLGSFDFSEAFLGILETPSKEVFESSEPAISEASLLTSQLNDALPGTLEDPKSCVATVVFEPGSCSFSDPAWISLFSIECPSPALLSCASLESTLLLSARGCASGDTGKILLAYLYPRVPEDSYDKCSVLEVGLTRAVY